MNKFIFLLFSIAAITISSCAKVYYSPDAKVRASSHQVVAIAPPSVTITARKNVDAEAIKEQQKLESANFQKEMYSWLLRRKMQNRIFVEVQDVETTNALLGKAGYFDGNPMTPYEISEALGVDAIITSNFSLSRPMSEGAALAIGVLSGFWGSTNNATVTLQIQDKETKKLLWNYDHTVSGSVGSTPAQLVDNLMRNASRKMPYFN